MTLGKQTKAMSRRDALRWVGAGVAVAPLSHLLGCGGVTMSADDAGNALDPDAASSAADAFASVGTDAATTTVDAASSATGWATGGTAAMTDIATYPNPFEAITTTSCTPFCVTTEGPCHDDLAPGREDISEGQRGLPVRLGIRIVDDTCTPVTDANVDVWHCDVDGIYSSETADNPPFCTGDDATALAARWFRGHVQTDANGVAWFNTCFPGWYRGRAIHIHFTVRRTTREGSEYLTSQLAFDEALIEEICGTHVDYADHGQPDTANTSDNVFPADSVEEYELETARMTDGAMLAWKTIAIRSSLASSVCGGSGMMGPPGG